MNKNFAQVAVNVPHVTGLFDYHVPDTLKDQIEVGHLVVVPFGKQVVQGVVVALLATTKIDETRPVQGILDNQITLTNSQIEFAKTIQKETFSTLAHSVGVMLPPGLNQIADTLFSIKGLITPSRPKGEVQGAILNVLNSKGDLRGRQLDRLLPKLNWRPSARRLVKQKLISATPILPPPRIRAKYIRTAQLSASPEEIDFHWDKLSRNENVRHRRQRILEFLLQDPDPVDVAWVYAESEGNLQDLKKLSELGLLHLSETEAWRDPLAGIAFDPSVPPKLTSDQKNALDSINHSIDEATTGNTVKPIVLHGVTGSGKTEIYLEAVEKVVLQKKQALIMVPEIALTPQTIRRVIARFPGKVGLVHSKLSTGELYDTWRRIRLGKISIIVGTRSALFSPFQNLGIIILDEFHDASFSQNFRPPYYHAKTLSIKLAKQENIVCILGSATPDVESFYYAKKNSYQYIALPKRILAHQETIEAYKKQVGEIHSFVPSKSEKLQYAELPPVHLVDMREELKMGNRSIFSRKLIASLEQVLQKKQQAILFLNRRGLETYIFCRDCGHTMNCPRCTSNLTHHAQGTVSGLICHQCGHKEHIPDKCPNCESTKIRKYGMGTERVEKEIGEIFPKARTLRLDTDTTRQKETHQIILNHFRNQQADILVGTQMLAKGLDLPFVTLVGIVLADVSIHLPDYRAGERTFQLLTQVAGRAGRSPLGGQVVLQTFHPEHYVIKAAETHNYLQFANQELAYREKLR
ncbi:MAG: primosomal protein N', partial [Chloroflexi bacterium]|nr:primosomal protein N' [Chloroflexota bacterium]